METKEKTRKFLFDKINLLLFVLGIVCSLVGYAFIIVLCVVSSRKLTLNKKYSLDLGKAFEDYVSLSIEFKDNSSGVFECIYPDGNNYLEEETYPFKYKFVADNIYIKIDDDDWEKLGETSPYEIFVNNDTFGMPMTLSCTSAINTKTLSIVLIPVGLVFGVVLFLVCGFRVKKNKKVQELQSEQESNTTEQANIVEVEPKNNTIAMEEELNSIKKMLDTGVITEQEYDAIRKTIIEKYFKLN